MAAQSVKTTAPNQRTGEALQEVLVDLIDFSLHTKQAHWNVTGPLFRNLHLHLDEIYSETDAWVDELAERMVAIGVAPDGRSATLAGSRSGDFPAGAIDGLKVIDLLTKRLGAIIANLEGWLETVGESDLVTQDLLIEIKGGLEKQHWMLRSQR